MAVKHKYFAYSADHGFEQFATAQEAEKFALELLDQYREDSYDEGWSDDVASVCWGELKQNAYGYDIPNVPGETRGYDYLLANV